MGRDIPQGLLKHVFLHPSPPAEVAAISRHSWGEAKTLRNQRLYDLIQNQQTTVLSNWKDRMLSDACKWAKKEATAPYVIKDEDNRVIPSKPQAVIKLRNFWSQVFGSPETAVCSQTFLDFYHRDFPPIHETLDLPPIDFTRLRKVLSRMNGCAPGPDAWSPDLLIHLPPAALTRLAQFLTLCECTVFGAFFA